jgi:hypothetical protein
MSNCNCERRCEYVRKMEAILKRLEEARRRNEERVAAGVVEDLVMSEEDMRDSEDDGERSESGSGSSDGGGSESGDAGEG